MIITKALILQGRSLAGGWTKEQLRLLGVDWPKGESPRKGWLNEIIGRAISEENARRFLELGPESGTSKFQRTSQQPELKSRAAHPNAESHSLSECEYPD